MTINAREFIKDSMEAYIVRLTEMERERIQTIYERFQEWLGDTVIYDNRTVNSWEAPKGAEKFSEKRRAFCEHLYYSYYNSKGRNYYTFMNTYREIVSAGYDDNLLPLLEMFTEHLRIKMHNTLDKKIQPNDTIAEGGVKLWLVDPTKGADMRTKILREGVVYDFFARCIEAGGHNIQCWHYRYIIRFKEVK